MIISCSGQSEINKQSPTTQLCIRTPDSASFSSLPPYTENHIDLLLQPSFILLSQIITPAGIPWESPSQGCFEVNMQEKQVGMLEVLSLPPLLHVQSPSIIPGSVSDYLLWLLLMLYTNFQGTKKILV